jgi:hypothetical protein
LKKTKLVLLISIVINLFLSGILIYVLFTKYPHRLPQSNKLKTEDISLFKNDSRTMVALTLGQSNAANYSDVKYKVKRAVYSYNKGELYKANDPLPGASDKGGSVWSVLGDMLIDSSLYDKVIIIPIAEGGTNISCWGSGNCNKTLIETLKDLKQRNIQLTHVFLHQGESDNLQNTSKETYKNELQKVLKTINTYQVNTPFYISIASFHSHAINKPGGIDTNIQNAQKEFINEHRNVYMGAFTDTIIHAIDRYDGIHFSGYGIKKYATSWFNAIKNRKKN